MNEYKVTDINNASYLVKAHSVSVETINNVETYVAFYVNNEIVAVLNLSNIITVIKIID